MDIVRVELWGESEARRDEGTYTYFYALRVDAIREEWNIKLLDDLYAVIIPLHSNTF